MLKAVSPIRRFLALLLALALPGPALAAFAPSPEHRGATLRPRLNRSGLEQALRPAEASGLETESRSSLDVIYDALLRARASRLRGDPSNSRWLFAGPLDVELVKVILQDFKQMRAGQLSQKWDSRYPTLYREHSYLSDWLPEPPAEGFAPVQWEDEDALFEAFESLTFELNVPYGPEILKKQREFQNVPSERIPNQVAVMLREFLGFLSKPSPGDDKITLLFLGPNGGIRDRATVSFSRKDPVTGTWADELQEPLRRVGVDVRTSGTWSFRVEAPYDDPVRWMYDPARANWIVRFWPPSAGLEQSLPAGRGNPLSQGEIQEGLSPLLERPAPATLILDVDGVLAQDELHPLDESVRESLTGFLREVPDARVILLTNTPERSIRPRVWDRLIADLSDEEQERVQLLTAAGAAFVGHKIPKSVLEVLDRWVEEKGGKGTILRYDGWLNVLKERDWLSPESFEHGYIIAREKPTSGEILYVDVSFDDNWLKGQRRLPSEDPRDRFLQELRDALRKTGVPQGRLSTFQKYGVASLVWAPVKGETIQRWLQENPQVDSKRTWYVDDSAHHFKQFPAVQVWPGALLYTGGYNPDLARLAPNVIQASAPGSSEPPNQLEITRAILRLAGSGQRTAGLEATPSDGEPDPFQQPARGDRARRLKKMFLIFENQDRLTRPIFKGIASKDADPEVQRAAVQYLGLVGDAKDADFLLGIAARSPNARHRLTAIVALVRLHYEGSEQVQSVGVKLEKSRDGISVGFNERQQRWFAEALAELARVKKRIQREEVLADESANFAVRVRSAQLLAGDPDTRSVPTLIRVFLRSSANPELQETLLYALTQLAPYRLEPPIPDPGDPDEEDPEWLFQPEIGTRPDPRVGQARAFISQIASGYTGAGPAIVARAKRVEGKLGETAGLEGFGGLESAGAVEQEHLEESHIFPVDQEELLRRFLPILQRISAYHARRVREHSQDPFIFLSGAWNGLQEAARKYPASSPDFIDRAIPVMNRRVLDQMRSEAVFSKGYSKAFRALQDGLDDLWLQENLNPTLSERATASGLPEKKVLELEGSKSWILLSQLEAMRDLAEHNDSAQRPDFEVKRPWKENGLERAHVLAKEYLDRYGPALTSDPRAHDLLRRYYLDSDNPSLKQIGLELQISGSTASKIHSAGLKELRRRILLDERLEGLTREPQQSLSGLGAAGPAESGVTAQRRVSERELQGSL